MKIYTAAITLILGCSILAACSKQAHVDEPFATQISEALDKIGLDWSALTVPKVPYPVATKARLPLVDRVMHNPPTMIDVSRQLLDQKHVQHSAYIVGLLQTLGLETETADQATFSARPLEEFAVSLGFRQGDIVKPPPKAWQAGETPARALRTLLYEATIAHQAWLGASGKPTREEQSLIQQHIAKSQAYRGVDPNVHRVLIDSYHSVGAQQDLGKLASAMIRLLGAAEQSLPAFELAKPDELVGEWQTPMGRIRIAGSGDDTHSGGYLLLVDLGGNDTYQDVGQPVTPGNISIVIDLSGNDTVTWDSVQGPGTGLLGMGLWMDMAGNDNYKGANMGLGTGLLGTGLFIDAAGDDSYDAEAHTQGSGQYGVGILLDEGGNDRYVGALHAQGYGGSGGIGMLVDHQGNDSYSCKDAFPDPTKKRATRHPDVHYLSMCQGYAFGIRDTISGGIGLLMDHTGDDIYTVDIFGQGASYWFGLGMLVDGAGNDVYKAFEHAQGEGLHLSAGLLADWAGNDSYTGYEHVQGVGMDRAAGVLYEDSGNDNYQARRESQGAGLKSLGVGLLIENRGNDTYKALTRSQGFSGEPEPGFPESEWPTGILLDLAGNNKFDQPYTDKISSDGRIQNRQGVAIDYGKQP